MTEIWNGIAIDARLAARRLLRARSSSVAAWLCLALGAAATLAVVRTTDALWFGTIPSLRQSARVQRLLVREADGRTMSYATQIGYATVKNLSRGASEGLTVAGLREQEVLVRDHARSATMNAGIVTDDFFSVLDLQGVVGRIWNASDPERGVIVSERFASAYFGDRRAALGQTMGVGRGLYTIIAVLPPGFLGTEARPVDLWLPARVSASEYLPPTWDTDPEAHLFKAFVRLRPGVSQSAAAVRATTAYRLERGPSLMSPLQPEVALLPLQLGRNPVKSEDAKLNRLLLALAAMLWLTICSHVGGLVLARAAERRQETAVALALGASRRRLARPWIIETGLLVLTGIGAGAAVAPVLSRALISTGLAPNVESYRTTGLHVALAISVLFVVAVTLGALTILGAARRGDHAASLATARVVPGSRARGPRLLLFCQVALSTGLVYAAGLTIESFARARAVVLGFDPVGLRAIVARTASLGYSLSETDRAYATLADRARLLPGVQAASVGVSVPFYLNLGVNVVVPEQGRRAVAYVDVVAPGYFQVAGIALKQGREFDSTTDRKDAEPVVVISRRLATSLFGSDRVAIGRCLVVRDGPCRRITGVVGDLMQVDLRTNVWHVYLPLTQEPTFLPTRVLIVRERNRAGVALERLVQEVMPGAPTTILRMDDLVSAQVRPWRLSAILLSAFGAVALLILGIGTFGVASQWVSNGKRDAAVRIALGSPPIRSVQLVLTSVLPLIVLGAVAGICLGSVLAIVMASALFGTSPFNLESALIAVLLPVTAAFVALVHPAVRVMRLDPAVVLRE